MYTLVLSSLLLIAFLLQYYFGYKQIKYFSNELGEMRRIGRVVTGKKTGKLRSGTIVMVAVDNDGVIRKAVKLQGVTAFSKFKELYELKGRTIHLLNSKDLSLNKLTLKAIDDAVANYKEIVFGIKKTQKEKRSIKKVLTKVRRNENGNISKTS